jgi:protein-tyrosine phosphatase
VIDLHSHVLPGIDDGPGSSAGSLEMLRVAAAAGIETMLATPHVSSRYGNDSETIGGAAEGLAAARRDAPPSAVEVLLGAEVALTRVAELSAAELERLRLGDGPWVLLEPPFATVVPGLDNTVSELHQLGHRVLLAHPERCPAFHRDPALLERLVDRGVLTSLTAGSLVGRFGGEARRLGLALLDSGMAHNVASDAHDPVQRPPSIGPELAEAGRGELEDWLTREVPAAILAGQDIPRRPHTATPPAAGRSRFRWPWRERG